VPVRVSARSEATTAALVRQSAIPEEQPTTVSLILIYVVVFGALMMFMSTRGRKKRASQAEMLQSALMIGAEVRTIGGLVGTVVDLTDEYIVVETTPGVKLKFTKQAIAGVVPPETPELDGYGTDPELETESADAEEPAAESEDEAKAGADEPEDAKDEQKV
jgi:preprotein translocase subunit YajC